MSFSTFVSVARIAWVRGRGRGRGDGDEAELDDDAVSAEGSELPLERGIVEAAGRGERGGELGVQGETPRAHAREDARVLAEGRGGEGCGGRSAGDAQAHASTGVRPR